MAFPTSPTNGQISTVNGIRYSYNTATNSWTRISNAKYTASASAPSNAANGDEWYDTGTDILFEYINDGTASYWVDTNSVYILNNATVTGTSLSISNQGTVVGNLTLGGALLPSANASQNIGSVTSWWGTFYGVSQQAKYADLAENYISDAEYSAGTVVVFGGDNEITTTIMTHDTRVAGVISTNPGYLMNAMSVGLPVAFTGRVPCMVQGPVDKGTLLVTSNIAGVARQIDMQEYKPGCVLGKSLETITDSSIKTIEVVVGRF